MKVGEIWVNDAMLGRQLFFVHNIHRGRATMSGINEYNSRHIYCKANRWHIDRKATAEEERFFYVKIEAYGFKFDRNLGVLRID